MALIFLDYSKFIEIKKSIVPQGKNARLIESNSF